jgi:hypothetical protein
MSLKSILIFLMSSNFFDLFHVCWFFVACNEHVYQCYESPYDKGYCENIVIIKSLIKSHIVYLDSKNHIYLCVSCVGRKRTYAQLNYSY